MGAILWAFSASLIIFDADAMIDGTEKRAREAQRAWQPKEDASRARASEAFTTIEPKA